MSGRSGMATGARRGQGCRPRPVCRYRREAEGRGGPSGPPRPYGLPVWVPAGQGTSPGHGSFTSIWLVYQNHKLTKRLPNAQEGGWRAPILEARRRVSPSNFQRPARPRPDFRTVEAIKRFTPRPPAPRTARPCPQGFQGPQVTPSPQLRADASTRSHISAHGWAALIRRRSSRAERANSAES